jgi:hypothetical protein
LIETLFSAFAPLLRRERLHPGYVAAHHPHPRRVLELPGRALEPEIELLILEVQNLLLELVAGHDLEVG